MTAPESAWASLLRCCAVTPLLVAVTACGGGDEKKAAQTTPPARPAAPTPPPIFSAGQVAAAALDPQEVGPKQRKVALAANFLKDRKAPMCSLSTLELTGEPQFVAHQFGNKATNPVDRIEYFQLLARYPDAGTASAAFTALQKKAKSCPAKRHVPPRKVRENFTTFAHDDTWRVAEDRLNGWTHLRGSERQLFAASSTKGNIIFFVYDYAVRGNLIVSTLYYERTEKKTDAQPVAERATTILSKQLEKLG